MTKPTIAIRGVTHSYEALNGPLVLDGIDLDIGQNEFVSLLGPSGCGKTTLMHIAGGLVEPSGGRVQIDGQPVGEAVKQRKFGFVFQDPTLLPWRNVLGNATLLLDTTGHRGREEEVRQILKVVGLEGWEDHYPRQLSGGMQQRVALARALALSPEIMLMDEPFAALDAITRDKMALELLRIWDRSRVIVFVTHSIPEAILLSDRVIVMSTHPGKIVADVTIDLPRPRTADLRGAHEFGQYELQLRGYIEAASD